MSQAVLYVRYSQPQGKGRRIYLNDILVAPPWRDLTLSHRWGAVHGVTTDLRKSMPMDTCIITWELLQRQQDRMAKFNVLHIRHFRR